MAISNVETQIKIIKKEKRNNETFYFVNALESFVDIRNIIHFIEMDGYKIDMLVMNFIHDDATFIAPKRYDNASDLLDDLQNYEIGSIYSILYNLNKNNMVRQGTIYIQDNVITCAEFMQK